MVDRTSKIVCLEIQRNINRRFFSLSIVIFFEGGMGEKEKIYFKTKVAS